MCFAIVVLFSFYNGKNLYGMCYLYVKYLNILKNSHGVKHRLTIVVVSLRSIVSSLLAFGVAWTVYFYIGSA
jgi:hypothetical protein